MKLSILLTTATLLFSIGAAHAHDVPAPLRTFSVTGTGSVQAAPDVVNITIGVTSIAPTARAALDANNAQTTKVFAFLKSAGVAAKDMQSTNLSVQPQYRNYRAGENRQPEIIGYMVNNNLRVAVRKLDSFGQILDGVVTAGANNINGIRFDVTERETLMRKANANAVKDAIAQAQIIAEAAGVKLGPIQTINLSGSNRPPQQRLMARAEASAVPVAAGELSIDARASIVFTIE